MHGQLLFPQFEKLKVKDFGGSLVKGNPREARPISTKRPLHLVMRSSLARGERSFLRGKRARIIFDIVQKAARSHGVKIYRYANSGNHLHLIILPDSRRAYRAFVRTISGLIARVTLGVERGRPQDQQFWDARPFTRILEWGRDFQSTCAYLKQNVLEALGFIPVQPRRPKTFTSKLAQAG